jgi:hypothetical protein
MNFESPQESATSVKEEEEETPSATTKPKRFGFGKKKKYHVLVSSLRFVGRCSDLSQSQRFSKLSEENEEFELDSENSRGSTPSPVSPDDLVTSGIRLYLWDFAFCCRKSVSSMTTHIKSWMKRCATV